MSTPDAAGEFRRLRILHLTQHSEAGGLSRYVHDLAAAMYDAGHDVRVAGARGAWHDLFVRASFPYVEVPMDGGPLALWRSARMLKRYLAANPVDVLHSHYRRTTLVARRLQRAPGSPPLLYTLHLTDMPTSGLRHWWADYGDHVHAPAIEGRRWAIDAAGVPAERITVLPHGIKTERFPHATAEDKLAARRALGLGAADRVASFVGRLDDPKNAHWVLDVAGAASRAALALKVILCGAGPHEADLRRRITERNLASYVLMLGERPDPLEVYQASDALLLPSAREGFSLVTAEAMAVGVPVLRTRTAGAEELVLEGVTGRTTPIDHDAFVEAAVAFVADSEGLARMSEAAARHVREHFTFERQVRETIALYERLAGRRGATPARASTPATVKSEGSR